MSCFNVVESNMQMRQVLASSLLLPNESLLSISFPSLGVLDFTNPPAIPTPDDVNCAGRSIFFPDEGIYQGHPRSLTLYSLFNVFRFRNLVRNIRARRGEKVAINVPIFRDTNTPKPFIVRKSIFTLILFSLRKSLTIRKLLVLLFLITFIWTIWDLEWDFVVYK